MRTARAGKVLLVATLLVVVAAAVADDLFEGAAVVGMSVGLMVP